MIVNGTVTMIGASDESVYIGGYVMNKYEVSIIDGNGFILEILELNRPCLTGREYKIILQDLLYNARYFGDTGFVVAYVKLGMNELFNISARKYDYGSNAYFSIRISPFGKKSMFLRSIAIRR